MAYLAVNKDGSEVVFNNRPFRGQTQKVDFAEWVRNRNQQEGYWYGEIRDCNDYNDLIYYENDIGVDIPKGSIKKLIGRDLTWEDEPIKLT